LRQRTSKTVDVVLTVFLGTAGLLAAMWIFGSYRGVPLPVAVYAAVAFVATFVLRHTKFGRGVYAVGGNEKAAWLSGIKVRRTKVIVYTVVAILSALAGILLTSRLNGASPNLGMMFELDAIAAVVIGGTSLQGGVGTIGGTVVGTFIIGVLNNGMSLMGIPTFYQLVIKGLIIIFAVWFDVMNKRKSAGERV
jgi:D-xylose transport system permease protein